MVTRHEKNARRCQDTAACAAGTPTCAASIALLSLANRRLRCRDSQLCRIRAPTLIIASARDRLFPSLLESARLLEAIPGSRRVILPDAAHSPLLEAGVSLAQLLRNEGWTANVFNGAGDAHAWQCPFSHP